MYKVRGDQVRVIDLQIKKRMHPGIPHLLPDLVAHDVDFLLRVAEHAGEEGVGEGLEAFHYLEVVPGADFFL